MSERARIDERLVVEVDEELDDSGHFETRARETVTIGLDSFKASGKFYDDAELQVEKVLVMYMGRSDPDRPGRLQIGRNVYLYDVLRALQAYVRRTGRLPVAVPEGGHALVSAPDMVPHLIGEQFMARARRPADGDYSLHVESP